MANGAVALKITQDRRKAILEEIEKNGSVKNSELSILFDCSEVTIRNDIRDLCAEGLLVRTRGGAVAAEDVTKKPSEQKIFAKYVEEKKRIAEKAFSYIEEGEAILIDDSSTGYFLASHIAKHPEKELIVVTNGIRSAFELSESSHVELHVIGGYVGGQSGGHLAATLGDDAISAIEKLHVDKGFIGVHSVNLDVGITSSATPKMQVKRAIIKSSKQLFVLADNSKFENGYISIVCPLSEDFTFITDTDINPDILKRAEEAKLNIITA